MQMEKHCCASVKDLGLRWPGNTYLRPPVEAGAADLVYAHAAHGKLTALRVIFRVRSWIMQINMRVLSAPQAISFSCLPRPSPALLGVLINLRVEHPENYFRVDVPRAAPTRTFQQWTISRSSHKSLLVAQDD